MQFCENLYVMRQEKVAFGQNGIENIFEITPSHSRFAPGFRCAIVHVE